MYHIDTQALQMRIKEEETTVEALAKEIGVDRATLYRRMKTGKLRIGDVHGLCDALGLSKEEAVNIFLAQ